MRRTLAAFAESCGGTLRGSDRTFAAVSTDTRSIDRDDLFVALRGDNFDGNTFVDAACAAGAAGVVVDRPTAITSAHCSTIQVADTLLALQQAAVSWRHDHTLLLVGVAGSNGKTTVKEMIANILSQSANTLATRGNLNNHIGVPLTLLRLTESDRYAVIEMGANRAGDVAQLVGFARPNVGVVTNAGAEHLEGFGSLEAVARAEGEMFAGLDPGATAVINADDAYAALWRNMTRARVITFGLDAAALVRAENVRSSFDAQGFTTHFVIIAPSGRTNIALRLAGMHNVTNALGAAAAAIAVGASLPDVARGLAKMQPVAGRLQCKAARNGAVIIDDSYNANPSSMFAAIDVLASLPGPRWLAIGDMAELGDHAQKSHVELGKRARANGIERLYAVGPLSTLSVEAFGIGAQWFPDGETLARALECDLTPEVRLLIKGSRVNRLERVVDALVGQTRKAG